MPRHRSYDESDVLHAAMELFWTKGFTGASLSALEKQTGLSRSSLYLAFGDKRRLFERVLAVYRSEIVDISLAAMGSEGAGLAEIGSYFRSLATSLRSDPARARRGCLIVNMIVDLAPEDAKARNHGAEYREQLYRTFRHALHGAVPEGGRATARANFDAELLATATLGLHLEARFDPGAAAARCDSMAAAVVGGRLL